MLYIEKRRRAVSVCATRLPHQGKGPFPLAFDMVPYPFLMKGTLEYGKGDIYIKGNDVYIKEKDRTDA